MNSENKNSQPSNSASNVEEKDEAKFSQQLENKSDGCSISSWLFQRCLGFVYLSAFGSMAFQIVGLIGHRGIAPIDRLVSHLQEGGASFLTLSSIVWFNSSDAFLQAICWAGVVSSSLLMAGLMPPLTLFLCWLLWLSIVNVGSEFLSFQWDILLLESGFLAVFIAPWRLVDWPFRKQAPAEFASPHSVSIWLFRWLLFRLMFESGMCKINSGDTTWRFLTALSYHYHTQPLPTPLAWFADKQPEFALKASTLLTLVIELIAPFLIFIKRTRLAAAMSIMLLQIVIALTGNYAYFNLLTFALCLFLIEDQAWLKSFNTLRVFKTLFSERAFALKILPTRKPEKITAIVCALVIAFFSVDQLLSFSIGTPAPFEALTASLSRLYMFNSYGLFATMTTERDEIILEGSMDGNLWKQYEFQFKPSNIFVPPCIVAPAQPRLDWQMWFAALGDVSQSPWFANFIVRIFQRSPAVMALLKTNPFPDKPPAFLRARLYRYTFSDLNELMHGGQWWRSEYKGEFLPAISADAVPSRAEE